MGSLVKWGRDILSLRKGERNSRREGEEVSERGEKIGKIMLNEEEDVWESESKWWEIKLREWNAQTGQTDRQTDRQHDRQTDSMTERDRQGNGQTNLQ